MRVLAINSMFANALYRRCADELGAMDDIDLTVLTVDEWRMNGKPMHLEPVAAGAPYRFIEGRAGWRGYENRGFYRTGIRRALRAARPDAILLMEEPFSIFSLQILMARRLFAPEVPVVFFTWNNLSLKQFDYRPSIFYRNVARWTLSRMQSALTANSDGIHVLRDSGFDGPCKVVGYGVDTAAYSADRGADAMAIRNRLGFAESDVVVGYVGRLLHMKGIDLLIDAISKLRAEVPNLKLLLVGSGEAQAALECQAIERGVADILCHVAVVPHTEVPVYMQAMDVLVLPSRRVGMWAEQFGRVLVEAMASGRIVIGSSSGAIPEVIGDAGFVFEENNASDLLQKLKAALGMSTAARTELAARAKKRAAQDFSWHRFASDARDALVAARGPLP